MWILPPNLNYISQKYEYRLVIPTKSRGIRRLSLPYVSRTRSTIAQYIKQNNGGRRTTGYSQPGIVNKTAERLFYLQKWGRLF